MNLRQKRGIILSLILVLVFTFTGCMNNTSYDGSNNVVEASQVGTELSDNNVIIIDARSKEDYDKGHLNGAISLPASELTISEPVKGMLAPKEQVEKVLSSKGISNNSTVYIYDNSGGVYASRVWWTLRVYGHENVKVINNGQKGLELEKLEMSLEVPALQATNYVAKEANKDMIVDLDYMKTITADENSEVCIIDVRGLAEYEEGAIPNAVLYPHTKNLYKDGAFKSKKTIYLSYNDLGLERDDTIVLYCKTSFRATQTAMLLEEAGFTNVKIYDGAWLEWSMGDMPTEKKEEKVVNTPQDAS